MTAIGVTANICGTVAIIVPVKSKAKSLKDLKGTVFANKKGTSTDFAFQSYVIPSHGLKTFGLPAPERPHYRAHRRADIRRRPGCHDRRAAG